MKRFLLVLAMSVPLGLIAQHPAATAGQQAEMSHHAFLEAERAAIEKGEGFGMALPATTASYSARLAAFGPRKSCTGRTSANSPRFTNVFPIASAMPAV